MIWDVLVYRTRDGMWAARINGTWCSNDYYTLRELLEAIGNRVSHDVFADY